ncbi:TetR/AcrR family transcriptional regulator [Nocardia sp. NPDC049149]|uniref:TetR/AcrR family transcriptional regulator n=1 Tax=Nocardia sp. NPDC049149 TaxID=3364315 RepID=UPI00371FCCD3
MSSHKTTATGRRPRRHDPDRAERIAEVVEELIAERGIEGLSHRAIAERADVSLSSTTYHFKDREALIRAGLQRTADRFAEYMAGWAAEHAHDTPAQLTDALTDAVLYCCGEGRTASTVEYELFLAALRRPELRDTAARLEQEGTAAMTPVVGPVAAAAIQAVMNGLCLQAMTSPAPPARAEIRQVIAYVVDAKPA